MTCFNNRILDAYLARSMLTARYRVHRLVERLHKVAFEPNTKSTSSQAVWIKDIKKCLKGMSNRDFMVEQMHDTLKAYYEIARPLTVDAMIKHGMDSSLLSGDGTPLNVLCPQWVTGLDPKTLERIAGEDADTKSKREELKRTISALEKGKKILQNS
jgi:hypothetical protein